MDSATAFWVEMVYPSPLYISIRATLQPEGREVCWHLDQTTLHTPNLLYPASHRTGLGLRFESLTMVCSALRISLVLSCHVQ